jgi:hypothetical protein
MTLTIGQLTFDALNGPVSFRCLKPTTRLIERGINANVLLCLGDEHQSRNKVCNIFDPWSTEQPETPRTLSTFTPLFLRILDSLGTQQCPVDYFVEAYFPTEFLSSNMYFADEYKPWVYQVDDETVMTWVAKFHLECFAQSANVQLQCPSSNVQYHFADLRLGKTFAKLEKEHSNTIKTKAVDAAIQNFYPYATVKKTTHDTFSRDRKLRIYKQSVDMYENLLYNTFLNIQSPYRSRSNGKVATINEVSVFEILKLLYDQPEKCAQLLFDPSSRYIRKSSMLYAAIQSSVPVNIKEDVWVKWCTQLFTHYFAFVVKSDSELQQSKDKVIASIKSYGVISAELKMYAEVTGRTLNISQHRNTKIVSRYTDKKSFTPSQLMFYEDLRATLRDYREIYDTVATSMLVPFNDMFVLFSSWKTNTCTPLTLYHAGEFHCKQLAQFLIDGGLYEYATPSVEPSAKVNRCLNMNKQNYDVDAAISETFQAILQYKKYQEEYKNKQTIVYNRISVLGVKLYKQVLSGRLITHQELLKKIGDFELDLEETLDSLELQTLSNNQVFIPKEYTNKLRF